MDLRERVAYLQGLARGLHLDDSPQGRVLDELIGVLGSFADSVQGVRESQERLEEYLTEVDYDLSVLEEERYLGRREDPSDASEDEDDEDDDGDDEDDEEFAGYREVRCPRCGQVLQVEAGEESGDDGQLHTICPNCGEVFYIEEDDYQHQPDDDEMIDGRH